MEAGTIQVNFCKDSQCHNFGIPAKITKHPRGLGEAERDRDTFTVVGSDRDTHMLRRSFYVQYNND